MFTSKQRRKNVQVKILYLGQGPSADTYYRLSEKKVLESRKSD